MNKMHVTLNTATKKAYKEEKTNTPGYPIYPASEDIYFKSKEEREIDPENISKKKAKEKKNTGKNNEKDFKEDKSGSDLDVPGSELDDENEDLD